MATNEVITTQDLEIIVDRSPQAIVKPDFQQAEEIADSIIATTEDGDPYPAMEQMLMLNRIKNLAGMALAKVMHHLAINWNRYGINDDCIDTLCQYTGFHKITIKRYIGIWDLFASNKVPGGYLEALKNKPINDLTPVMGALNKGYKISDENWKKIVDATSNQGIAKVINKYVKGKETDSDAIYYIIDKVTGNIFVQNRGKRYLVARFFMNAKDEPAQRGIARIVETMNMQIVKDS